MVSSLALCFVDVKQDPVVYGATFGVVFLAKGPRTASIQKSLECRGLYHLGLIPPDAHPACAVMEGL